MEYKGYLASISYDDVTDMLHGRIVNSGDYSIVTFTASDVEGLKREFKISIEDYLSWCEEDGVEPIKPNSGEIKLSLGPKLHHTITLLALEEEITPHDWIIADYRGKGVETGKPR